MFKITNRKLVICQEAKRSQTVPDSNSKSFWTASEAASSSAGSLLADHAVSLALDFRNALRGSVSVLTVGVFDVRARRGRLFPLLL